MVEKTGLRLRLFDTLRGLSLVSMIAYHATYDLVAIFGVVLPWYFDTQGYLWQQSICWGFILLSGICWQMGRNPLKRGLLISACGLIITLVTVVFMPSQLVIMGILSFLGAATLIMIPVHRLVRNLPPMLGVFLSALLFAVTRNVNRGYLGFERFNIIRLPGALNQIKGGFALGFPPPQFYSSDYFSVLPWFFLFLTGYFIWRAIAPRAQNMPALQAELFPLSAMGRNSLAIYLLHQPVILAVLWLVMR